MSGLSVLGVLGLPGAGKTTATKALSEQREDVEMIQMSSVAGDVFDRVYEQGISGFPGGMEQTIAESEKSTSDVVPEEDTSKALAEFADTVLGIDGTFFSRRAVAEAKSGGNNQIVVDGIRSTADVTGFKDAARNLQLVFINTPFSVRLDRLTERGRDSEKMQDPNIL